MEQRFRGLSMVGFLLRVIGVAEMVLAVVGLILIPLVITDDLLIQFGFTRLSAGSSLVIGISGGVVFFIGAMAAGLLTYASGELFNLFIALEENTRAAIGLLKDRE